MNTQVVEEKEKNIYIEILKVLIKLIFKAFKFGLYLVLQLLKLLIRVVEGLFKLDEYRREIQPQSEGLYGNHETLHDKRRRSLQ